MGRTAQSIRRRIGILTTAAALGAAAIVHVPAAGAAPTDPCAVSQVARTVGTVANNTGLYLDNHPDADAALTTISQQPAGPQSIAALKTYFDANPAVAKDLQTIQQPLTSLSAKCRLPISLPALLGLMQAAQQGGLPGAAQVTGTGPAPGPTVAVPANSGTS